MYAKPLGYRFEKSLYDLIRGLRNHKGHEKEYIQNCLKECRAEIRGQDMDIKATALLKLIYLEMMGHDMSWASFNVLEVMSSPKHHQKRIGYLGAVQSYRPDTEVLMLATNLLKKDLTSGTTNTISLPIHALPHFITPSLALSTLADLLPRLTHTNPSIRKKTIVTLYRLALVYPETLRAAWPKIKERLMAQDEDPSVTAAIVNVVSTAAMSLLYECINGIIQGGILGSDDDVSGSEEIASLCVTKLRGMIMVDGDPNLKYVALLAFNKIVVTHPFMVAQQEDVIMECIDNPDITIRVQALNLVQGMVSSDNLMSIVGRLMRQLKSSSSAGRSAAQRQEGNSDSDADAEVNIDLAEHEIDQAPPLPDDYKVDVINRILTMCSHDNYSNLVDFEWYIDILTQLARMAPVPGPSNEAADQVATNSKSSSGDVSAKIGDELRSVAVKVMAIRQIVVGAAELILRQLCSSSAQPITSGALRPVAWIVGEYSDQLLSSEDTLGFLLQLMPRAKDPDVLASCLQATIKIFAQTTGSDLELWTSERKAKTSLLLARIIHVLEPLVLHPNLEVQERAVEFTELLKLTSEAVSAQDASTDEVQQDPPLLLTQAIPSLFTGWELNSVAPAAQSNVPLPQGLDLDEPIHPHLANLLSLADDLHLGAEDEDEFEVYYHQKPPAANISSSEPAINRLADTPEEVVTSYQASEESYLDADILARRKAERAERNKDDPFYIGEPSSRTGTSTPIHSILQNENGPDLDIDAIPIMQLDLGSVDNAPALTSPRQFAPRPKPRQRIVVAQDENLGGSGVSTPRNYDSEANNSDSLAKARVKKIKQSLLQVDSSNLGSLSLEGGGEDGENADGGYDFERQKREEAEMVQAMKEVERLRLEMQRANERIHVAQGVEGTVVKKKKKAAKPKAVPGEAGEADEAVVTRVKKKKKKPAVPADEGGQNGEGNGEAGEAVVKPKKKKKPKPPAEIQEAA
ncbi:hypothetical protein INS49_014619 [Diaporthe citri]|uniref:uncharacterized protein n=1 Tax=Diaporthe citri TaxID=83186 RepID=UPI001C7E2BF0|nr:uncharacterized protein INS49_014619 [Diaporthe citri]KAG6356745.1 hypothetical protein INS49_014619 [Diaporthe citri]